MMKLLNDKFKYLPVLDNEGRIKGVLTYNDNSVLLNIKSRKVCVIGLGHVGLTLSLVMADNGFQVYGHDIDKKLIKRISSGTSDFYEKGLDFFLKRHLNQKFFPTFSKLDDDQIKNG